MGYGRVRCRLSTGTSFADQDIVSAPLDVGFFEGRGWADFNNDGMADYCRVTDFNSGVNVGKGRVRCRLSRGDRFADQDIVSAPLDVGYFEGRGWADVNNDKQADFCRVTDANYAIGRVRCRLSESTSFAAEDIASHMERGVFGAITAGIDVGFHEGRAWADFNNDGRADYCRVGLDHRAECTLSGEFRPDASVRSLPLKDAGFGQSRMWADLNNDGRSDLCRVIDQDQHLGRVRCTLSTVVKTVVPLDSYGVASGYCTWDTTLGGFTVVRVTDDRLDVVPVSKNQNNCAGPQYDGKVDVITSLVRSVQISTAPVAR